MPATLTADVAVTLCDCDILARPDLAHDPGCPADLVIVRATFRPIAEA